MENKSKTKQPILKQLQKYGLNPNHWMIVGPVTSEKIVFGNIKEPWLQLIGQKRFQMIENIQWADIG